jgi:predicted DsbA family dithiol-disulfide isomerase
MPSLPGGAESGKPLDAGWTPHSSFPVKITYYLEVISSWCHWAEPTWAELKARYAGRVQFDWKIALMRPEDFPASPAQADWFYRRSGTIVQSPYMLNSGWFEPGGAGMNHPNLVAEAAKDFGFSGDEVRLALAHAAVREGQKLGQLAVAVKVAAKAAGVPEKKLRARAESAAVQARVDASTAEFFSHRIAQRPAFILESAIGDKAVFSGIFRAAPLIATVDAMLADAAAYAAHAAHHGAPPKQ